MTLPVPFHMSIGGRDRVAIWGNDAGLIYRVAIDATDWDDNIHVVVTTETPPRSTTYSCLAGQIQDIELQGLSRIQMRRDLNNPNEKDRNWKPPIGFSVQVYGGEVR